MKKIAEINPYAIPGITDNENVIMKIVCIELNVDINQLRTKNRASKLVLARQMISFFLKKVNNMTVENIGTILNIDHSTVTHSIKVINNYIETNKQFKSEFESIKKKIYNNN